MHEHEKGSEHEESLQLECHHVAGFTWWLRGSDDRSNATKSVRRAGEQLGSFSSPYRDVPDKLVSWVRRGYIPLLYRFTN